MHHTFLQHSTKSQVPFQVAGVPGTPEKCETTEDAGASAADGAEADIDANSPDKDGAKKKKNKCQMCKKKVGLTGKIILRRNTNGRLDSSVVE